MSGTSLLRPRRNEVVEALFPVVTEALGVQDATDQEKLQALLETPPGEFAKKIGRIFGLGPVVDGSIIPQVTLFDSSRNEEQFAELYPGIRQCRRLFIGDCQMDVSLSDHGHRYQIF